MSAQNLKREIAKLATEITRASKRKDEVGAAEMRKQLKAKQALLPKAESKK